MMRVRFWGVRGSIAAAGHPTAGVGGNTSCVEVRCGTAGDETLLIFDAGTGLRLLGESLAGPVTAHLFLSHLHWDHIQGFPFFGPAYVPGNRVGLYAPERCAPGGDVRAAFAAQMRAPHFPVGLDVMRAELAFEAVAAGGELEIGGARVRAAAAKHPNGCLAYRVDYAGRSVVYATDTEHDAAGGLDADLLELARGADVLIYDAQYTSAEYAARRGWGHSTAAEGARLASAAGVSQLVLFHHDPTHDDWQIARIEAETRGLFPSTTAAREGLTLTLEARARRSAA
ncbi:MAG: Metal-dependent hydrolase of the beta-lactamase superfamily [Myxococcales bacterium]|nr:Metal-dependent hydrolase of the beta-lactamase superfamily [Myxococcales bacterium]